MTEHVFEEAGKAILGHALVGIGEVAIVAIGARRHASGDLGVEFGRIETPLLARIASEKFLVKFPSNFVDDDVFGGADRVAMFGTVGEELFHLEGIEIQAVEPVNSIQIDWDGAQWPAHTADPLWLC